MGPSSLDVQSEVSHSPTTAVLPGAKRSPSRASVAARAQVPLTSDVLLATTPKTSEEQTPAKGAPAKPEVRQCLSPPTRTSSNAKPAAERANAERAKAEPSTKSAEA